MPEFTEKQIKAAKKEGGKKGQDIAGLYDMGGIRSCDCNFLFFVSKRNDSAFQLIF